MADVTITAAQFPLSPFPRGHWRDGANARPAAGCLHRCGSRRSRHAAFLRPATTGALAVSRLEGDLGVAAVGEFLGALGQAAVGQDLLAWLGQGGDLVGGGVAAALRPMKSRRKAGLVGELACGVAHPMLRCPMVCTNLRREHTED